MSGSISRKLYRQCLLLYPESFRHEFEGEMLDMFEDCRATQGSCHLLADVVFSAAKQQISDRSTPLQKSAPLYLEIAWSPKLARVFAVITLGAALITGALLGGEKPKAPESWTLIRPEHRFPAALLRRSCSEGR